MRIKRLAADAVKRDKLYKFVCVDPVELTELELALEKLQKAEHNCDYAKCPNCNGELEITGVKCLGCDYSDEHFA